MYASPKSPPPRPLPQRFNVSGYYKTPQTRPSWRQSELDAEAKNPKFDTQKSFLNGEEVPYGTRGSSRPDLYREGGFLRNEKIIEVKNYDISTSRGQNRLINNVSSQINKSVANIPGASREVIIDTRGQSISRSTFGNIRNAINANTGGAVKITFIRTPIVTLPSYEVVTYINIQNLYNNEK